MLISLCRAISVVPLPLPFPSHISSYPHGNLVAASSFDRSMSTNHGLRTERRVVTDTLQDLRERRDRLGGQVAVAHFVMFGARSATPKMKLQACGEARDAWEKLHECEVQIKVYEDRLTHLDGGRPAQAASPTSQNASSVPQASVPEMRQTLITDVFRCTFYA